MPGSHTPLKALEIRRILLTSEAEIHREQVRQEWAEFKASFREIERSVKSAGAIISIASLVAAGAAAVRRLRGGRGAWGATLFVGAGVASALWFAIRSRCR